MRSFLVRILINALALGAAAQLISGIQIESWPRLLPVALVFGLVNATIRPVLKLLTCPLIILTLGLFTLVINALMLQLTSAVSEWLELGFSVGGFWPAFWGALVISLVSLLLSIFIGGRED